MTSAVLSQTVSADGEIIIAINQISQDYATNTSHVQVTGQIKALSGNNAAILKRNYNIDGSISGDANYSTHGLYSGLDVGKTFTFVQRTFTLWHGPLGNRTANFTVSYAGILGVDSRFPQAQITNTLVLDRIPLDATKPGQPQFSNEKPTSLTVTWDAPVDDGGSPVVDYVLRRYNGTSATGTHIDNSGNSLTRNLTGLSPGATYTFTVVALNGSAIDHGVSPPSDPNTITTVAGSWIRVNGKWVKAIPYVRKLGVWKQAIPYVRSGGTWKKTG